MMNPWFAKAIVLLASIVMVAIRAPYGQRSRVVAIAKRRRGALEFTLLAIAWASFFLPLIWIVTPVFPFSDYSLHPVALLVGTLLLGYGLWLFHRSHADLGTNWSITLEIRENHTLVVEGLYRRIRHPMYLALLIYSAGQGLVLPNYIVGPSYAFAMILLIFFRLGPEERMMVEEFGEQYEAYMARTDRLIPGIW